MKLELDVKLNRVRKSESKKTLQQEPVMILVGETKEGQGVGAEFDRVKEEL